MACVEASQQLPDQIPAPDKRVLGQAQRRHGQARRPSICSVGKGSSVGGIGLLPQAQVDKLAQHRLELLAKILGRGVDRGAGAGSDLGPAQAVEVVAHRAVLPELFWVLRIVNVELRLLAAPKDPDLAARAQSALDLVGRSRGIVATVGPGLGGHRSQARPEHDNRQIAFRGPSLVHVNCRLRALAQRHGCGGERVVPGHRFDADIVAHIELTRQARQQGQCEAALGQHIARRGDEDPQR